ncbi:hypothetical protein F5Y00DRAFT_271326 [Daldinia vernicosa]|uniref:uncharacterized protein n=1 Tax=Daldinia vernicosa TaxID=114800 RepID=UPI0020084FFE|nr:uncharacterized protein F5Y00DRAFT_271326 [Daldinia vernicosa]KAI0847206.1 hypothetical protein F5Y00DRAFT_271326 [Daldinia vernicosa]
MKDAGQAGGKESKTQALAVQRRTTSVKIKLAITKGITATDASLSKKRKAGISFEGEFAALIRGLDDIISSDAFEDETMPSCDVVRSWIRKFLEANIMNKTEFSRVIGCNTNTLNTFPRQTGPDGGQDSSAYHNTWTWLKRRQVVKLAMPNTKKQTQGANSPRSHTSRSDSKMLPAVVSLPDIKHISLDDEEIDLVSWWDSSDEIRRKISAHLETQGVTRAQFFRDLYAQLNAPTIESIQSKQLNDFRRGHGAKTGAKGTVFYAAYVYFEKLRLAQGKPKTEHRLDMEDIWAWKSGFDRETDHRTVFLGSASSSPYIQFDRYGRIVPTPMYF